MVVLFSNSGDPDQTPRSAASDLGLHCLLVTRLGIQSSMGKRQPCGCSLRGFFMICPIGAFSGPFLTVFAVLG